MKTATVTEAKNGLSALLDRVKAGESVLILDRGRPVARLEPVQGGADASARMARLQRAGLARSGSTPPPADLIASPPPSLKPGVSAARALVDERRIGR